MGRPHTQAIFDLKRRFGDNLILLRDRGGLSRGETAVRSGLHTTQIGLLERGLRLPRLDTIIRLAGALEVAPCDLLSGMSWRLETYQGNPGTYVWSQAGESTVAGQRGA
jgi:transcriptional regulator with XRE-family HTH domain